MEMIAISELTAEAYYWARRRGETDWQVVRISTVFGASKDYWTVARTGTDIHSMPEEYDFLAEVRRPTG